MLSADRQGDSFTWEGSSWSAPVGMGNVVPLLRCRVRPRSSAWPPPETRPPKARTRSASSLFEPAILRRAVGEAFLKLDPRTMARNPVMFTVEIGSVVTMIEVIGRPDVFVGLVTLWLWATVLFANFAEAAAEGRGKAQADTLRRSRKETFARLLKPDGTTEEIPSTQLRAGNLVAVAAGQVIPGDGDVMEGMAVVDESAITGGSAPVIRESGGDRSARLPVRNLPDTRFLTIEHQVEKCAIT